MKSVDEKDSPINRNRLIKNIVILLLVIINCYCSKATEVDSLLNQLSISKSPEERFECYKSIADYYHKNRIYDSALFYYSEPLKKNIPPEQQLFFLKKIGNLYVDSTNYTLALEFLNKALIVNKKVKAIEEYPEIYNLVGMCHGLTNDLDKAILAFEKGLQYNLQIKDSTGLGFSYYNLGLANHFQGHYEKAIEFFVESANIRQQINDTTALVASLISIGEIFRLRDEYHNARIYYNEALKYKKALKNKETLAYLYSELALIYKSTERYEVSLAFIDTAMNYCQQIQYKRGIATLLSYKAGIFKEQNKANEALVLFSRTIDLFNEIGFETGIVQSNIHIAEILYGKGRYGESLKLLEKNETLAQLNNLLDEQAQIAELKYKIYKKTGKEALALAGLENFMELKDSLFTIDKEEKISEIETKYQTEQKEKQIELLDRENKIKTQKINSRNFMLVSFALLVLLLVTVFILFFKRRKTQSELEIEKNRHQLLRSQMNPHFIFNALSAIQNFILKNNPIESVAYISDFSSLTRLVLEGARYDYILLKDDIKLVENYLKLQQLRFGNKFDYVVSVDKTINPEIIKIPPMLSQPFIENAVEHGMRKKENGEGKITVNYLLEHSVLIIRVVDNGSGIDKSNAGSHKSLATKITRERIENIKKTLHLNVSLNIKSDAKGTIIELKIFNKK